MAEIPRFGRRDHFWQICWTWKSLIVLFSAIVGAALFWRDELLEPAEAGKYKILDLLPDWSWQSYALITLAIAFILLFEGTYRISKERVERLAVLNEAWDRTDKYLVPVKVALITIVGSLEFDPSETDGAKLKKAASKIREVGGENQTMLWGCEYFGDGTFADHKSQISPVFWKHNMLDVGNVMAADLDLPQTILDERYILDSPKLEKFGRLMISKKTLAAMFPKKQT